MVVLAGLAFLLAYLIGLTPIQESYGLALVVSVALSPALLGFLGGRGLRLGAIATVAGIEFLPVVMALDARFHLGETTGFGWLALSFVFAGLGWRLGRPAGVKS